MIENDEYDAPATRDRSCLTQIEIIKRQSQIIIQMGKCSLLFLLWFVSCDLLSVDVDSTDYPSTLTTDLEETLKPYAKTFMEKYSLSNKKEAFLFFTDPHLVGDNDSFSEKEKKAISYRFKPAKDLYDYLPLSFCLCGGDWLKSGDSQDLAKTKLAFADEQMKILFQPYYKMMGNHDTNYQGVVSNSNPNRGDLPLDYINNVYYKDIGRPYFSFKGQETIFYILDSGTDWEPSMNEYRETQLKWLAESLLANDIVHIVMGIHIFINSSPLVNNPTPFAMELLAVSQAYNNRKVYSLAGLDYDFAQAKGTIHLILAGHNHTDYVRTFEGLPCVGSTQFISHGESSFDLCFLDYDNGYLEMIRIGDGIDRKIKLLM